MSDSNKLGRKLAFLAKANGFTQSQIAQLCGVSRMTIQRFFNDKTEIRSGDLNKILKILNLDLSSDLNFFLLSPNKNNGVNTIKNEVCLLLDSLDSDVQQTILKTIYWWVNDNKNSEIHTSIESLKTYITSLESQNA